MSTDRDARAGRTSGLVALAAALAAVAVSTYLTIEHYSTAVTFACPESATINCLKVTTSRWSVIAGVPVAVLGLSYFVVMSGLLAIPSRRRDLDTLRLAAAAAGVLMVFYLVYIELFRVDAICLWCTGVHALTVIMFIAVLWQYLAGPSNPTTPRPAARAQPGPDGPRD